MSILEHAKECAELFKSPETFHLDSKPLAAEFETQKSRFKVWAGSLGVFASGHASADFRFSKDENARRVLIMLLGQLAGKLKALNHCSEDDSEQADEDSEDSELESDSDSDSDGPELSSEEDSEIGSDIGSDRPHNEGNNMNEFQDIAAVITRLYRFTSVARKPVARNERDRVLRYIQNHDPPLDLSELKSHIEFQLGQQCKQLRPGSQLYDRLVTASLYRRQKILYFQSHHEKLQKGTKEIFQPLLHDTPGGPPGQAPKTAAIIPGNSTDEQGKTPPQPNQVASTLMGTEATVPNKVSISTYAKSGVISGITTSAAGRRGDLDIPPLPKPIHGETETQCPYCTHFIDNELAGKKSKREDQWKRHVLNDLDPYVCLFDDCKSGSRLFKTADEWIDHMKWDHTIRYPCQVAGHESMFYDTAAELEDHLISEHQSAFPKNDVGEMAKKGARPSPDVFAFLAKALNPDRDDQKDDIALCPMCTLDEFSLSKIEDTSDLAHGDLSVMRFKKVVQNEIKQHIASHMEKIALLSLPARDGFEDESLTRSENSRSTLLNTLPNIDIGMDMDMTPITFSDDNADSDDPKTHESLPPMSVTWGELLHGFAFPGIKDYDAARDSLLIEMSNSMNGLQYQMRRWLHPPDPSINARRARRLRHHGTGLWLLKTPVFQSWFSGLVRHVWLRGLPGCGKTILSVTVLDHLEDTEENDRLVLSFFFDSQDPTKQTFDSMLRSIAFQLHQNESSSVSAAHLKALLQACNDGSIQPTTEELADNILKTLEGYENVYLILDALDQSNARHKVLFWINDLFSRAELSHIQLFYTSRPQSSFDTIPSLIGKENCICIDSQSVDFDIRSWVTAQLSQRRDFIKRGLSPGILRSITDRVVDGANGMFIWASLMLDSLARYQTEEAMKVALESLPSGFHEYFQRQLESIPTELRADTIRLLQFIVHSKLKRPLKLAEANEIIATRIGNQSQGFDVRYRQLCETDILRHCPTLITVVDEELHPTNFIVKEYLLTLDDFNITNASISITRTYLTYLAAINHGHKEIMRDFPMARQAAELWTQYAVLCQESEEIVQETIRFLENEATFQRWTLLYQADRDWDTEPGPAGGSKLYYACLSGLEAAARGLIERNNGAEINMPGGKFGSALQAASERGHQDIVKLLLDKGADVNIHGGHYGYPLLAASERGHQDIVNLLLDHGADVNIEGNRYGNALQAASLGGHQEIVKLLLERGANVNTEGGRYSNALQAASERGFLEIIKLLLDKGANVNADGGRYGNALQAASLGGSQEVVKLLLDKGADVKAEGGRYGNALQAASVRGSPEVVKLLLNQGVNVNNEGGYYGNALQAASWGGSQKVVKLLLDNGADVNAEGGRYGNALQAASVEGSEEIVKLLLDRGADINAEGLYGSALQVALKKKYGEVVKLLQRAC